MSTLEGDAGAHRAYLGYLVSVQGVLLPPGFRVDDSAADLPLRLVERGRGRFDRRLYAQTNWTVGDLIRDGTMNTLLLRPVAPIVDTAAAEIAGKVVFMAFAIPVAGLLLLVLSPADVRIPGNPFLFAIALLAAWALRFLWGYSLALAAFWSTRSDALVLMQDALVFVLAGQVAPVCAAFGVMPRGAFRSVVGRVPPSVLDRTVQRRRSLRDWRAQSVRDLR